MDVDILYEDKILLVVNKPSGILTQASVDRTRPDLYSELQKKYPYVALHHRLDSGTSGVLLLCKNKAFNKEVSELFKGRTAKKKYLALCCNVRSRQVHDHWEIENHLGRRKNTRNKKAAFASVQAGGDFAHTVFRKLREQNEKLLIEAQPLTGRTHQIRVHLYEYGLPIYGDKLYTRRDVPKRERLMLHAYQLEIVHPQTKKPMIFEAPIPPEFQAEFDRTEEKDS